MKMEFDWNKPIEHIVTEAAGGKEGLLRLANTAKRFMDLYVPADDMALAQLVWTYVEGDHGVVHYLTPYAHYQYEGIVYVDPKTGKGAFTDDEGKIIPGKKYKVPAEPERKLEHSKFRHPLATSHWDKAMMAARKDDLIKDYENYLKGRG